MTDRWRRPAVVAGVVVLVPFAILVVRVLQTHVLGTADLSFIELRVRDVGGSNTPLVGVYSRYAWNHPGPALFYALALPYRLFGADARAILVGGVLLNAAAVIAGVALLWRRGRWPGLLLGLVVLLVLVRALGGSVLLFPWNPYIVVLPLFLLVLLTWSVTVGDHWMLVFVAAVASFVIQAHIGTAVPAVALLAVATIAFIVSAARGHVEHVWTKVAWTVGVAIVMWVPALVDQSRANGGNLSKLRDFWTASHETTGFVDGARIVLPQLSVPGPWITGHERVAFFTAGLDPRWQFPLAGILLVAATVIAWRRKDRDALALDGIAFVVIASAWIAAAQVIDVPYTYLLRWTWVAGAVAWLAIGWTAIGLLREVRSPAFRRAARWAGAGAAAVLLVATCVSAVRATPPDRHVEEVLDAIDGEVEAFAATQGQPVLVHGDRGIAAGSVMDGVLLQLLHDGTDARLLPSYEYIVGPEHVVQPEQAGSLVMIVANERIPSYLADPRFSLVAQYDDDLPVGARGRVQTAVFTAPPDAVNSLPPQSP